MNQATVLSVPEDLMVLLQTIPNPQSGEMILLSLSMAVSYVFPDYGGTEERILPSAVVAIVASSIYPSIEMLIEGEIRGDVPEEDRPEAKIWLTKLWESGRLVQPRFHGLIPEYPRGGWRWTGPATTIQFRQYPRM